MKKFVSIATMTLFAAILLIGAVACGSSAGAKVEKALDQAATEFAKLDKMIDQAKTAKDLDKVRDGITAASSNMSAAMQSLRGEAGKLSQSEAQSLGTKIAKVSAQSAALNNKLLKKRADLDSADKKDNK